MLTNLNIIDCLLPNLRKTGQKGVGMCRALLIVGLTAAWCTSAAAQIMDVEQIPDRFIELFRQGDLDALTGLFAPDASFVPIVGPARLDNVDGIRGYFKRVFDGSRSRDMAFSNVRWQKYGDIVVRSADVVIRQALLDGRQVANPVRVTFVYQNSPQGWRIVHYHGSGQPSPAPNPATGSTPAAR